MVEKEREPLLGVLSSKGRGAKERLRARLLDDEEVEKMLAELEEDPEENVNDR